MLPDQPPELDSDEVALERRLTSVRLFVIRNGRLVELERRERSGKPRAETPAVFVAPKKATPE
jgi:hypothetical protein